MNDLEREIDQTIKIFELEEVVSKLTLREAEEIYEFIRSHFADGDPKFWWTSLLGELRRAKPG